MYLGFEDMNKEEREKFIDGLYDKFKLFIKQMAIETNTLDQYKSKLSPKEFQEYVEGMAEQLDRVKELEDMVEEIDILNILKDRM